MNKKFLLLMLLVLALGIAHSSAADNSTGEDMLLDVDEDLDDGEPVDLSAREIAAEPLSVKYSENKISYSVNLTSNGEPVSGEEVELDIPDIDDWFYANTNKNGVATFKLPSLDVGMHKIKLISEDGDCTADSYINVTGKMPVKTTVKAPAISVRKGADKHFKVSVKDKNGKAVKNLKLKVKVFTGKKYKAYTLKTNKKGVATLSTKSLKVGTHKVEISSGSSKYKVAKSSKIVVKPKPKVFTIKLSKLNKEYKIKYGKYTIEAMKWKAYLYQEVDIMVYTGYDDMLNKDKYFSRVFYSSGDKHAVNPWKHGSIDCVYHKYQFAKTTSVDKVQIKI